MSIRLQITLLVGLSTAVWFLLLLFRGVAVDPHWLTSFGLAVTIVTTVVVLVDRFFWRLGPLCRLVPGRPRIHGTWAGAVHSSRQTDPIPAFLVINQTLLNVSVNLLSEDGRSHSIVSSWTSGDLGDPNIYYTFRRFPSDPEHPFIRFGTGQLEICGKPPQKIVGVYWTDIQTVGRLEFFKSSWATFSEFDEAKRKLGVPELSPSGLG